MRLEVAFKHRTLGRSEMTNSSRTVEQLGTERVGEGGGGLRR